MPDASHLSDTADYGCTTTEGRSTMNITAAMLEHMLQRQGIAVRVLGELDCALQMASIMPRQDANPSSHPRLERGVAYVDLDRYCNVVPSASDGCVLLIADAERHDADRPSNNPCELEVVDKANAAIAQLEAWDLELKDAIINNLTLPDIACIGENVIDVPFCYVDSNLFVLMRSCNYDMVTNSAISKIKPKGEPAPETSRSSTDFLPQSIVLDLIEEERFDNASRIEQPFYYETEVGESYCINTFLDDAYLARFVVILEYGKDHFHPGQEQLVLHFNEYVKALYGRLAIGSAQASRQDDALHRMLGSVSNPAFALDSRALKDNLVPYSWSIDHSYQVMWLEFMENVSWSSAGYYMACQLEAQWRSTCAVAMDGGIMWVLNLSQMMGKTLAEDYRKAFVKLLADYVCKCGISSEFSSLLELPKYLEEARLALEYGSKNDPSRWHYAFDDYAFGYALDRASASLLPEQLCDDRLLRLREIDRTSGTDYARTLVCYLRNDCNSTHAANALFVHRTTLLHRLDRIAELVDLNLDDPDQKLHLLLSAKLLGM